METLAAKEAFSFLQGGGEMGAFIQKYNWLQTPVGSPSTWPQSLRTTLSIILNSRFPMFLFWGKESLCFYNDAYRPSLGNEGKHPYALGKPGADVWPEIWPDIKPLIDKVLSGGEATWSQDQLLPIYRNGKLEDVYWTFSYSAVSDESGSVAGVFVTCMETTEAVVGRKQIEESEQRFRNLVREATVGIVVLLGQEAKVALVNDAYAKLIGREAKEVADKNLFEIIPEAEPYFRPVIDDVRTSGQPVYLYGTLYFVWVDGVKKEGFLNLVYQPYKEVDGTISGVMVLCQDVTEQVVAIRKKEASEQRFQAAVAAVQGILWTNNAHGEMEGEQPGWGQLTGQSYEEYQGYGWATAVHPDDAQPTVDTWNEAVAERKTFVFEHRVKKADGDWGIFSIRAIPLLGNDGNIREWVGVHTEITERKQMEQALQESEASLRTMILQAPLAICIFRGTNYVFDIVNMSMEEMLGKKATALEGKPFFDAVPEVRRQGLEELLDSVMHTGTAVVVEEQEFQLHRGKRMETVYVNYIYQPLKSSTGAVDRIMVVATDVTPQVTARRKIEEVVTDRTKELALANSNLQRSNAELAQFAYIASHDLQEPVRKISTFTEMLETGLGAIDERSASYLNKIKVATSRMLALIRDVLNFSQLSKEEHQFVPVDLNAMVQDCVNDFELAIEQKSATILLEGLPVINAIPLQMAQLFNNLFSNALKFSNSSRPPVITITGTLITDEEKAAFRLQQGDKDYHYLVFKDNGIGFRQEHAEQIFNIFQRLHGRTEYSGTGIGLALCKKIVENHHGQIWATSAKENGAVFHILLPERQQE